MNRYGWILLQTSVPRETAPLVSRQLTWNVTLHPGTTLIPRTLGQRVQATAHECCLLIS